MSSPLKPIDFEALRKPQAKPVSSPTVEPHVRPTAYRPTLTVRDWLNVALICAVVFFGCLWLFRGSDGPGPNPGPVVDVDGLHVLVLTPDDRSSLTSGQNEFANSAKIADWVEQNGGKYRRYPESQDITNEEQVWQELRQSLSSPHHLAVLKDRRLTKLEIPDGIDAGIRLLEGFK